MTLGTTFLLAVTAITTPRPIGRLQGQVVDAQTKAPIANVSVSLAGTDFVATADVNGLFAMADVPVGVYYLVLRHENRPESVKADIVVRSARTTVVNAEMSPSLRLREEVTVAGYFQEAQRTRPVTIALGAEELRLTSPGGDISRALSVLPGASQVEDSANDLVVRGGSPAENGYYIDNIPIPNINHFPQ